MASVTIRNLDEQLKKRLKLQAAANDRSMEEEIRRILADSGRETAKIDKTQSLPTNMQSTQSLPSLTEGYRPDPSRDKSGPLAGRRITLVITGGIAAYKSLDLIRRLRERDAAVRVIMTRAASEFVTPLAAGALASGHVHTDLFDPRSEFDVGHIRLARDADLVVVAPCTADFLARMMLGLAEDLAGAVLLATNRPILIAPAMNPQMWKNKATQRNLFRARADGVHIIGPNAGEMAESGEAGTGRMSEPLEIADAVVSLLLVTQPKILAGKRVLVTAGPTHEPIDPVRVIANRSSGKQGFAIAAAAAEAGARVTLIAGPVCLPTPPRVERIDVETALEMQAAVRGGLPADCAILVAAVADWRVVQT
ncbi:MAG TPA: bifunctional phosphopantothenoylcysteine decarboxylase/phosphopantothenate--cysteine ligase CoaBC, partial [Xanthobacteraceae bacterium]|nr:bifunctional phosphopantothenoylcysteine decarboxylase/phosphopantothenate--cysteine ligase CoaBC [Xanthobacteraceae bacterium]